MKKELVITVLAEDRPGLVAKIADCVRTKGGNWIESRMSQLGGRFAGILRVEVAEDAETGLAEALRGLSGLEIMFGSSDAASPADAEGALARLEILAQDRPGIVAEIFGVLSKASANVIELTTERFSAPMSAELLFKATARLRLPPSLDTDALHAKLEDIAHNLTAELHLTEEG